MKANVTLAALALVVALPLFSAERPCEDLFTQQEMNECAHRELARADRLLNVSYQSLLRALPDAEKESLRAAQRAWLAYRDKECRFEAAPVAGGTMYSLQFDSCATTLTSARSADLQRIRKERPE